MGESCANELHFDARNKQWHDDPEMRDAVWTLVHMCGSENIDSVGALVSDLLSRVCSLSFSCSMLSLCKVLHNFDYCILFPDYVKVGIGDSLCVVFHRPGDSNRAYVCQPICSGGASEMKLKLQAGIPEELLLAVLRLLKKYLMDDSVVIVEMTSQALRVSFWSAA